MTGKTIVETRKVIDWLESALAYERLVVRDCMTIIDCGIHTSCQDCDAWCHAARAILEKHTPKNRVINSPKVINSPSENFERKGK